MSYRSGKNLWALALLFSLSGSAGVVINEVCYKNSGFDDGTGNLTSDWVELYNNGNSPVDIGGYSLGKKKDYEACGDKLCVLPSYTMAPGEFLVVYFNKDLEPLTQWEEIKVGGTLKSVHRVRTNVFSLGTTTDAGGGTIYQDDIRLFDNTSGHNRLSNVKGEDIGGVLEENTSYGFLWDGNINAGGRVAEEGMMVLAKPTPGSSNAEGFSMAAPELSAGPGIYAEAKTVTISSTDARAQTFYYTLDGTDPRSSATRRTTTNGGMITIEARANATANSGDGQTNAWIRTSPPELESKVPGAGWKAPIGSVPRLSPLRVVAAYGPGFSEEAGGTYGIGADYQARKLPIVSLFGEADDWFSDEHGLYVPGLAYQTHGYGSGKWGKPNANYFAEDAEVAARFELLEPGDERPALSFDLGVALLEGGIRALPQKSIVCVLRGTEYGTRSIDYALFPEYGVQTYRRFVLDNGGKDWNGPLTEGVSTMMRGAVFHRIAASLDLSATASRPVSVFLNGDYWGIHQLSESRDKHFFATRYNLDPDNIDLVVQEEDSSSSDVAFASVLGHASAVDDYKKFLKRVDGADVATDEGFAVVAAEMDVDNYMDYVIAETFFANGGWPMENCDFWRVHAADSSRSDAYGDGRWRWMLSDLSLAGKEENGVKGPWRDMLAYISTKDMDGIDEPAFLINRLWRNEGCKNKFIDRYVKLLNTVFHPDHTSAVVRESAAELEGEIVQHYRRWGRNFTLEQWQAAVEGSLVDYLAMRWTNSFEHLDARFDLGGVGGLRVSSGEGGKLKVAGGADAVQSWSGLGFVKSPITVVAVADPGKVFAGWSDGVATAARTMQVTPGAVTALSASFVTPTDSYVVRFDPNGGEGEALAQVFPRGESGSLAINAFAREGYVFSGWATSPTGAVVYADGAVVKDLAGIASGETTLYAVWAACRYQISFDANGGEGVMPKQDLEYGRSVALPACGFSRDGYEFIGWALESEGAVCYADGASVLNVTDSPGAEVVFYARWAVSSYWVKFDANGGSGAMADCRFGVGVSERLAECRFTREGHRFMGWSTTADGEAVYAAGQVVVDLAASGTITLYAVWGVNDYEVAFDANGGTGMMAGQRFLHGVVQALSPNRFACQGHSFAGWALSRGGALAYVDGEHVCDLASTAGARVTLYAIWAANVYTIEFDANGGRGTIDAVNAVYGERQQLGGGGLSRPGYKFVGWSTRAEGPVEFGPADEVENLVSDAGGMVTLYAVWQIALLYPEAESSGIGPGEVAPWMSGAVVYDGYVFDGDAELRGTLQVKVGKANARTGIAKMSATFIAAADARKTAFRNGKVGFDGIAEDMRVNQLSLRLALGRNGMSGALGGWRVDGARNLFSSRDRAEKTAATALLPRFAPGLAVAWCESGMGTAPGRGWSGISMVMGAKGRTKIVGTRVDGSKVSVSGQLLVGADRCCVPALLTKGVPLAFEAWSGMKGWTAGNEVVGLKEYVAGIAGGGWSGTFTECVLPAPFALGPKGYEGWKPRVTAKTGALKGTFKVYATVGGKAKKYSAVVNGVVVDGVGYGTAVVKKNASWAVVLR